MGKVYRARDTRLNRDVALKVLPESLAADRARLSRFDREAQVLASLNHPNIAHLYGIEDDGTTRALVMELVPGADTTRDPVRHSGPRPEAGSPNRWIEMSPEGRHLVFSGTMGSPGVFVRSRQPRCVSSSPGITTNGRFVTTPDSQQFLIRSSGQRPPRLPSLATGQPREASLVGFNHRDKRPVVR